ncbi:unnamed protein product [Urochloa decumbens]|uniref:Uncharacterized protein n=1 Tax=Urochloa decumbens TaxID=240449 RepID=A0ABC9A085_9POAL
MASCDSEVRQYCDTELTLGHRRRPAPPPPACAREEEKAPATPCAGAAATGGLTATELHATAILRMARRAAAAGDGADARLSTRRSLERFLQRRREAGRRRGVVVDSPSSSCLTDSSA